MSSRRGHYLIIMGSLTTACMLGSVGKYLDLNICIDQISGINFPGKQSMYLSTVFHQTADEPI